MKVTIERKWPKPGYTIGRVYIDGEFFCNSLEDRCRGLRQDMSVGEISRIKVVGETAIPTGKYKVAVTYSVKYKREMPQIMCVPGYSGVKFEIKFQEEYSEDFSMYIKSYNKYNDNESEIMILL